MTEKEFMKITNKDIYDMIKKHHEEQMDINKGIMSRLDVTNGKVKLNRWVATTALSIAIILVGFMLRK